MSKLWTPGPWTVSDAFNVPVNERDLPEKAPSVWLDRKADGCTGLQLRFVSSARRERILADAHLIAAAPALYEALEMVRDAARDAVADRVTDEWVLETAKRIDHVLALARGEEVNR